MVEQPGSRGWIISRILKVCTSMPFVRWVKPFTLPANRACSCAQPTAVTPSHGWLHPTRAATSRSPQCLQARSSLPACEEMLTGQRTRGRPSSRLSRPCRYRSAPSRYRPMASCFSPIRQVCCSRVAIMVEASNRWPSRPCRLWQEWPNCKMDRLSQWVSEAPFGFPARIRPEGRNETRAKNGTACRSRPGELRPQLRYACRARSLQPPRNCAGGLCARVHRSRLRGDEATVECQLREDDPYNAPLYCQLPEA